ncbi:N-acetylmuramoyl-L-alanine amidase [Paraliomyxa miuraensis]|uniref:N-acetylmuramoyl-L-alanine amidase n=1 Tax=Paraliomyxa miuraensis TaxID=376150 RepID=UPI002252BB74|nr:N-acetylmuramoyl-L-alanine amidase [Paraliomyxa miuraensis]MCX4240637.1 N-acetylmuramoyl-L-alanine amidase [Paraliomyxa miuraensis]
MTAPNVTWQELADGVTRPDGAVHRLVVERVRAHLLEMEDAHFHFDSVVMQAQPRRTVTADDGGDITGIAVIAAALRFGEAHPDERLLVVGHTDTAGSRSYNQALSEDRAKNVHAVLTGDRSGWARGCQARHHVEDWQRILKWVHQAHGWDCDPGDVDNVYGPMSRQARERFRARYNLDFGGSLAERGPQCEADWEAFFELYDVSLAQLLGVPQDQLSGLRSGLTFLSPPILACGEQWPKEGRSEDGLRSAVNRRVELLFFDQGEVPDMSSESPPGASLYGDERRFPKRRIPVGGAAFVELTVVDLGDEAIRGEAYELDLPHGVTRTGQLDERGRVRLEGLPPGDCTLRLPNVTQAFEPTTVPTGAATRVVVQRRTIMVKVDGALILGGARQLRDHPVEEATVEIVDQGRQVVLGDDDEAMPLDITDLGDGDYTLRVTPRDAELATEAAGPGLEPAAGVEVAYRALDLTITLAGGQVTAAAVADPSDLHGGVLGFTASSVDVDLWPDFLASPHSRPRGGAAIDMVVIQHSGAATLGPTLEAYLARGGAGTSAHYVIDPSGFVVKMVRDADAAEHSRHARWAGSLGVRERSIGIELVHASGALPAAQLDALKALVQALVGRHGFADHHVVGLEDVATSKTDPVLVGRRMGDPGPDFDWAALEGSNLGLRLSRPDLVAATAYGGVFAAAGGKIDGTSSAPVITELQNDLAAIGYSLNVNGSYDKHTRSAVRQFVLHFAKHARARGLTDREKSGREVLLETARELKRCQTW